MIALDNTHRLVAFEGFEMTGKSTSIKKAISHTISKIGTDQDISIYRPSYDSITDDIISKGNRYLLGLGAIDMFRQMNDPNKILLLDRWVASSYVYMKYHHQISDCLSLDKLIKVHKECSEGLNPLFIHKFHKNEEEAEVMYDMSTRDSNHTDDYDRFSSFEDYWLKYLEHERLFEEFYNKSRFAVIKITSYSNKIIE